MAEKPSTYEIKLQLGLKTYENFDGCPFPLEAATDDEQHVEHIPGYKLFFIQFDTDYGQEDQTDLLVWFSELITGKNAQEGKKDINPADFKSEKNALLFPASLSKLQRAAWHGLAEAAGLQSKSEGFGGSRALRISGVPPKNLPSTLKEPGAKPVHGRKLAEKAKRIWTWAQEEGGSCLSYSQGEISQILEQALAMPPDLAQLCGKRDMADRLFKAIGKNDERRAIAFLEKEPSLAWIKETETGGFALHHASWHGLHSVAATIVEQNKQTVNQKDKNHKTALQVAKKARHESIVKMLIANGAKDPSAKGTLMIDSVP